MSTIQGLINLNGDKYLFSKRPYFNHSEGSNMNDLTPGLKNNFIKSVHKESTKTTSKLETT